MAETKKNKWLEYFAVLILFLIPFLHVSSGVDVSDSGYSLGNYMNMQNMDGMWVVATFLANGLGKLFTMLPFGSTWLGMNAYCTILISLTSVSSYLLLRKTYSPILVFIGELLALSLCWCPHVIIYNYLSYFCLTLGSILLLIGLKKQQRRYFLLAGAVLSSSVFARFPNIVQALLIVVVWYDGILEKKGFKTTCKNTFMCIIGYLGGAAAWYFIISGIYGFDAYYDMIASLFGMTKEATSYTPKSMVITIVQAYAEEAKVALRLLIPVAFLLILCSLIRKKWMNVTCAVLTCIGYPVFLLWAYRRQRFVFNYNDYRAMYFWAACFLMLAFVAAVVTILSKKETKESKLLALTTLVILVVTPLGSNNGIYPNFNNLFLIAPFCLQFVWNRLYRQRENLIKDKGKLQWICIRVTVCLLLLCTFVQCLSFGFIFTFRDTGFIIGTDSTVEGNDVLKGMHTNATNARQLEEITSFIKQNGYEGRNTIFFGNIPSMGYILGLPCALSHTWPDLDSYPVETMRDEIANLDQPPLILVNQEQYPTLMDAVLPADASEKAKIIAGYMTEHGYNEIFFNGQYALYEVNRSQ